MNKDPLAQEYIDCGMQYERQFQPAGGASADSK
jgi:hypothetical protein